MDEQPPPSPTLSLLSEQLDRLEIRLRQAQDNRSQDELIAILDEQDKLMRRLGELIDEETRQFGRHCQNLVAVLVPR